ncbi:MAG: VTC domain-containing protein, partial [Clostridia bacterium]|nr:VTC domain-containing protein [Clostridia bacterium]
MAIMTMSRYEIKYILNKTQAENFTQMIKNRMEVDEYGLTSIASLYYDTPDSRLIRKSIEKPEYKEKIRLRSYGLAKENSPLFLELKRKADGIVYKRRAEMNQKKVDEFFGGGELKGGQIEKEISYFRSYYKKLVPAC